MRAQDRELGHRIVFAVAHAYKDDEIINFDQDAEDALPLVPGELYFWPADQIGFRIGDIDYKAARRKTHLIRDLSNPQKNLPKVIAKTVIASWDLGSAWEGRAPRLGKGFCVSGHSSLWDYNKNADG
jgi:hypothetical protein